MPTFAELVTPERILFSGDAEFVVLRTEGGEIMFLPNHADFVAAVDISVVRISRSAPGTEGGGADGTGDEFRAAVHGGFVHVADNHITVLASVAEPADEIDVDRARRAFEASREAAGSESGDDSRSSATDSSDGDHADAPAEQSATMRALLSPDDPDVALRRAEVRLDAAGALEGTTSGGH